MDITVLMVTAITIAAAATQLVTPEATAERIMILMPFIGAVFVMGGAVMLNPVVETRKITIGRALFGTLFGVGGPSAMSAMLRYWGMDSLQTLMLAPGMLLFEGAVMAFCAYWMSKPFCRQAYERADAVAKAEMRRIEKKLGMHGGRGEEEL